MDQETIIRKLMKLSGGTRDSVIKVLDKMSKMPEIQKAIKEMNHGKK